MTEKQDYIRHMFRVYHHPYDASLLVRTDLGYCGSVLFDPFDGTPAILLGENNSEISGEFKKIDNDWYFRYTCVEGTSYVNVLERTFVFYSHWL